MPFPATPSPFRLSRRDPSTRRNGPQFAPTPRFLLSQSATQKENGDLDVIDDDGPSSTPQVAHKPPSRSIASSRRRDVIEDSHDAEFIRRKPDGGRVGNEIPVDDIESSPPEEPETPGILDAEFDALFAPVRDRNKRRRVEGTTPLNQKKSTQNDPVLSSSPEATLRLTDDPNPSDDSRQSAATREINKERTPAPTTRQFAPAALTPGDGRTKTPFRGRPRFVLSSAAKPPSSQFTPKPKPDTPQISPPERRKPVFVLPRSPSPNPDTDDIPVPFSPSSRTLRRRGKNRAGASNYVPGGMAAEVRSWVLEMGANREQFPQPPLTEAPGLQEADALAERLRGYSLTARIIHVSQSALHRCGSLAFLRAEACTGDQLQGENAGDTLNIMIMGHPRSESTPLLCNGDLVGIYKGLNWSLPLGTYLDNPAMHGQVPSHMSNCGSSENGGKEAKDVWLIVMEWDLIERAK